MADGLAGGRGYARALVTGRSPAVSVVVATRDRKQRLAALLESLRAQTLGPDLLEVIVVDDGSSDGTAELLENERHREGLELQVVRRSGGGGPGAARNAGWPLARAQLVAFTDDDCVAEPRWAEAGLEAWGGEALRIVQGATTPIEAERPLMGPLSYSYDVRSLAAEFSTCNMFYPRALLERLGGFDADAFPVNGEDTDLAWRAQALGAEAVFEPEAHARHAVVRLTPGQFLRRNWSWGHAMLAFARHEELRRVRLHHRFFWNIEHYHLLKLAVGLALPRRVAFWPLKAWLARGYLRHRYVRPRASVRSLGLLGWFVLVDSVETVAILRGALRHRTLVL